ncbi:c-type cytochrome [Paucibacter soli]|uniref:c-type cytochrome n=1 Tax=Paucibacter soli TaxID=3133433 RepID=UPI00309FF03A
MGKSRGLRVGLAAVLLLAASAALAQSPAPARQQALLRMLKQDCGSCHGMQLNGGLGPAIHVQAMRELPRGSIAAVIYHGRPGTPMPGWKTMLSAEEAEWLAGVLQGEPVAVLSESKP